jgi:PAS domain-containing protein
MAFALRATGMEGPAMEAHDEFPANAALSLMLAVIATSDTPLLLLSGDLTVIAASTAFCVAFGIDPASVPGNPVLTMGKGEWNVPQLASLLTATASGAAEIHAYELDLRRPGQQVRRLVLNAHRLDYDDKVRVRLLLAVADVTDARASEKLKDDLIRDKAVLLREVQHRIANSLQIIASVLCRALGAFNPKRPGVT